MGNFSNTQYKQKIDSLISSSIDKLKNPYYNFVNETPTPVDYLAQNVENTSIDPSFGDTYEPLGADSPTKFNLIEGLFLYGLPQIAVNYDVTDEGYTASPITGEATILPNTIVPKHGDMFYISYTKEKSLFRVDGVTIDTLDNSQNFYKITYTLITANGSEYATPQIVDRFKYISDNVGTDFKVVIRSSDVDLIESLSALYNNLILYYIEVFFKSKVQSFIYNHNGVQMYDPYLIEFLKRNKILSSDKNLSYVAHQTALPATFSLNYSKTFFASVEECNPKQINDNLMVTASAINDYNSLFSTRMETYFSVDHSGQPSVNSRFQIINPVVIKRIVNNEYVDSIANDAIYNVWVAYFNNNTDIIKGDLLSLVKNFNIQDNSECFYSIPITIFILENNIERLMRMQTKQP